MSDSDDDNIVRYGTQLEPYEEDCTCTMPKSKSKLTGAQKKKVKRLLAANVNVNKAREVCHLAWPQICQIIPGIEQIAPETCLNPPKESKKKHPTVRVRPMEHLSRELDPDLTPFWHNPCDARDARCTSQERGPSPNYWKAVQRNKPSTLRNEYDTNHESFLDQPYRPPQTYTKEVSHTSDLNYWQEAGPSQPYETNRRKRPSSEGEPHWESPYKITKGSQVDCGEPNYWERDRSPARSRHDATPVDCRSNNSYEHKLLKYSDTDPLQVTVQDGMRAVNRHYNDSSHVKPFSDQPYKAQKTSESGTSLNYWPQPDRPSRLGLRNETHPPKRAHTYSYSEDKNLQVSKYQKISWDIDYRDDRPLRDGLRNETQEMTTICIDDESDEEYRGRIYTPHTPVDDGREHFDLSEPKHRETSPENDSHFHWDQPSENQETLEDNDANVNKDAELIRVGIRNVSPMSKKQMTLVQQFINQAIVRIGVQGAGPKFSGSTYKTGWILMICENHMSRKWLEKKVPSMKPWPEANLFITPQNELPKPHYIILLILIPDKEGVTVATALELLRIQNPGLDRDNWKVIRVTKTYSGQIVFLSVDEASFEALRLLNFKANLGMDKVNFWVRSRPSKRDSFVPSAEDVPLASSSAYKDRESNSISCAGENTTTKVSRKRRRIHRIRGHITHSQPIDIKPSLLGRPVLLPSGPSLPQVQKANIPKAKKRWYDRYGNVITE